MAVRTGSGARAASSRAANRNRASGWLDFYLVGDQKGVQQMLMVLDTALNPLGISAFLSGVVGPWIKDRATDRFISEGDDVSGRWAPLSAATQEVRSRGEWPVSPAHPINVRTHELQSYITQSSWAVAPNALGGTLIYPGRRSGKKSLREKMRTAQRGRSHPSTPPRPVLGLNERDLAYVTTMLAFHIQGTGKMRGASTS